MEIQNVSTYPISHPLGTKPFPTWAIENIEKMFPWEHNLYSNGEVVYDRKLDKFWGRHLLIIGGGPSTLKWLSSYRHNYDAIWSMNNCFLNKDIANLPIDLICVGPRVNIKSEEFLNFVKDKKPLIGFDPHQKYGSETTKGHQQYEDWKGISQYLDNFSLSYDCFAWQTRFWSRIGIGARMMILAAEVGVKKIDYVGLDGADGYIHNVHAFEGKKGKENLPSSIKNFNDRALKAVFQQEYRLFWNSMSKYSVETNGLS